MNWAFWRRRKPRATRPGRTEANESGSAVRSEESALDDAGVRGAQAGRMRVRMRRRLIGAAALLLGTAVVVPMMLDPSPRPLPDSIPIDIPSERTPFAPHLSLPASAAPAEARSAEAGSAGSAPSDSPGEPVPGHGASEPVDEPPTASSNDGAKASPAEASAEAGAPAAEQHAAASEAKAGRWIVQAAALSSESAARQLSDRLSKAGMAAFVERTGSNGAVMYRVRLGPFDSREAAAKARKHLHAMGVGSNVMQVEAAAR